jgi:hypothetical protein
MVRGTGITTSLLLIALGAVLAFAINIDSSGIDINAIGAILIVVGLLGLLFSFLALGELDWFGGRRYGSSPHGHEDYAADVTPPHEHRRVDTTDVVYEDDHGPRTERVHRVHR